MKEIHRRGRRGHRDKSGVGGKCREAWQFDRWNCLTVKGSGGDSKEGACRPIETARQADSKPAPFPKAGKGCGTQDRLSALRVVHPPNPAHEKSAQTFRRAQCKPVPPEERFFALLSPAEPSGMRTAQMTWVGGTGRARAQKIPDFRG
jgi:hypothetical protein